MFQPGGKDQPLEVLNSSHINYRIEKELARLKRFDITFPVLSPEAKKLFKKRENLINSLKDRLTGSYNEMLGKNVWFDLPLFNGL